MNEKKPQFALGGQALIEGVMMRSPHYVGAAVRHPDGHIETQLEAFVPLVGRKKFLNVPLVRGVLGMVEMLALGMKYLQWSSNIALEEKKPVEESAAPYLAVDTSTLLLEIEPAASPDSPTKSAPPKLPLWAFLLTITGSLGLGVLLFVALPNLVTDWTLRRFTANLVALNLFEGGVKLLIFTAYVWLIGQRPNIRRVFEFHGAEHKVVFAAENNLPITPESARPFDTPHPRCGTGFALLTVFVSIVCFAFLPWPEEHWKRVGWRLLLMPLVAGVSYEVIKLTVNPQLGSVAKFIMIPGMWLQRLTTRQPDDSQLEVACAAMQVVLDAENTGH